MIGYIRKQKPKQRVFFEIKRSKVNIRNILHELPNQNEVYKLVSIAGGFSSISFILYIADFEKIEELTVSSLRVGEKEFFELAKLHKAEKLNKAHFIVSGVMKRAEKLKEYKGKYQYFTRFSKVCDDNEWIVSTVKNHSKIILMRTAQNYYVIETSSNLNENPSIEQFSFENDKKLYDFYYKILKELSQNND